MACEAAREQADMGDVDPGDGAGNRCLEVLGPSRRHRPSHANVRSTTQRRGNSSKPIAVSERLMISIVQRPS